MRIVADTSVFIAVVMNEPEKQWVISATRAAEAIAPHSLPFEIGNAITRLVKRRLLTPERARAAWEAAAAVPVSLHEIDLVAAVRLACSRDMYAYDAFMLQCALETSSAILTLDKRLKSAAAEMGLTIVE